MLAKTGLAFLSNFIDGGGHGVVLGIGVNSLGGVSIGRLVIVLASLLENEVLDVKVEFPLKLGLNFVVVIFKNLSVPCQTEVLEGEVPLFVDVAVVILGNGGRRDVVLRPLLLYGL